MPITKDNVSFTYDMDQHLKGVPENDRQDAANDAGEAALVKIAELVEKKRSPVKGNNKNFDALSDKYAKLKQKRVGNKNPNLRLTGELIESLDVESDSNSFTIQVTGDEGNVQKAYNHNIGDTVPKRQFLPDESNGETFKSAVVQAIKQSISKYKKKPVSEVDKPLAPTEVAARAFEQALKSFNASKREQQIAKNVSLFKIEDIL